MRFHWNPRDLHLKEQTAEVTIGDSRSQCNRTPSARQHADRCAWQVTESWQITWFVPDRLACRRV